MYGFSKKKKNIKKTTNIDLPKDDIDLQNLKKTEKTVIKKKLCF